ncbi:unnamed protein product [Arabis nemorensis]|uniref:NYN domain-containing protein n=1 Tax=Arabis nemorensis TaxID=586526 RepID=A0A565C2N9_9BRAS|nr:unnamed protein product [Arabis nemorensis]
MPEEDETEAASIVQFLKTRHYNVLVVVGDEDDKCAYPSDVPLWRWKSLLEGGGPVSSVTRSEEEDDGSDTSDDGKGTSPRKRYRILDYLSRNYGGGEVVGHEPIGSD